MVPESFSSDRLEYYRTNTVPPKKQVSFLINYSDITVGMLQNIPVHFLYMYLLIHFNPETLIGSGNFGSVYMTKYLGTNVVLKQFMKQKYSEAVGIQMRAEAASLAYVFISILFYFYFIFIFILQRPKF
jgi:hypothetical protein